MPSLPLAHHTTPHPCLPMLPRLCPSLRLPFYPFSQPHRRPRTHRYSSGLTATNQHPRPSSRSPAMRQRSLSETVLHPSPVSAQKSPPPQSGSPQPVPRPTLPTLCPQVLTFHPATMYGDGHSNRPIAPNLLPQSILPDNPANPSSHAHPPHTSHTLPLPYSHPLRPLPPLR